MKDGQGIMPGLIKKINRVYRKLGTAGLTQLAIRKARPKAAVAGRQQRKENQVRKVLGFLPKNLGEPNVRRHIAIKREMKKVSVEQEQKFRMITNHLSAKEKTKARFGLNQLADRSRNRRNYDAFMDIYLGEKKNPARKAQIKRILDEYMQLEEELRKLHDSLPKLEK